MSISLRDAVAAYAAEKHWEYTNYGPPVSPGDVSEDLQKLLDKHSDGPEAEDAEACEHADTRQDNYGATRCEHCGRVFA